MLQSAGPLKAVIDVADMGENVTASDLLGRMRETALACAAHGERTPDFSLLFVFSDGHDAQGNIAIAAGEMLARTLALEWAPAGLRVNSVRWRGMSRKGLEPLCRFLGGGGASMVTGQPIHAGSALAGTEG